MLAAWLADMPAELSDAERANVVAMWAFRARGEHETAASYEDLGARLQAAGADAAITARVIAAAADEARHGALCAEMAARFETRPVAIAPARRRRIAPHELDGGARLAYEMVALFCVTESINATLLLRSWQQASDAATRRTLHALLADEMEHSRIGWAYLGAEPRFHDEVARGLPRMLAAATDEGNGDRPFLADPSPAQHRAVLVAHGLLAQAVLREVFLEAMNDVVLPGLELCGVATADARRWLAACTSRWA